MCALTIPSLACVTFCNFNNNNTQASAGNGSFYVKMYDGSYDAVGFDSVDEAFTELELAAGIRESEYDGQPTEQEEWASFDPDC